MCISLPQRADKRARGLIDLVASGAARGAALALQGGSFGGYRRQLLGAGEVGMGGPGARGRVYRQLVECSGWQYRPQAPVFWEGYLKTVEVGSNFTDTDARERGGISLPAAKRDPFLSSGGKRK